MIDYSYLNNLILGGLHTASMSVSGGRGSRKLPNAIVQL